MCVWCRNWHCLSPLEPLIWPLISGNVSGQSCPRLRFGRVVVFWRVTGWLRQCNSMVSCHTFRPNWGWGMIKLINVLFSSCPVWQLLFIFITINKWISDSNVETDTHTNTYQHLTGTFLFCTWKPNIVEDSGMKGMIPVQKLRTILKHLSICKPYRNSDGKWWKFLFYSNTTIAHSKADMTEWMWEIF